MALPSSRFFAKRSHAGMPRGGHRRIKRVWDLCPELLPAQRPKCVCGARMRVVTNRAGEPFWGCQRYPYCKLTRSIDSDRFRAYLREKSQG